MMAFRNILFRTEYTLSSLSRTRQWFHTEQSKVLYSRQTPSKEDIDLDKPVTFTSSKAASFNTEENERGMGRTNRPSTEPRVVQISLAVFLIYFLALREESDWDDELGLTLFERLPELEIVTLRNKRKMASAPGAEPFSEADRLRLEELEKELRNK